MEKAHLKRSERISSLRQASESESVGRMLEVPQEEKVKSMLLFTKHYQVSFMAALTTVVFAGVLGFLGSKLDGWYGSNHLWMIICLLISLPISQIVLYKWIKKKYIPRIKKLS